MINLTVEDGAWLLIVSQGMVPGYINIKNAMKDRRAWKRSVKSSDLTSIGEIWTRNSLWTETLRMFQYIAQFSAGVVGAFAPSSPTPPSTITNSILLFLFIWPIGLSINSWLLFISNKKMEELSKDS